MIPCLCEAVRHVDNPFCLGIIIVIVSVIITPVVAVVVTVVAVVVIIAFVLVVLVFNVVIDCVVSTVMCVSIVLGCQLCTQLLVYEWTTLKCLCYNLSNFLRCLVRIFKCLACLILSINSRYSLKSSLSLSKITASLFLHVSLLMPNMSKELFIFLTLSFINCLLALLIMS